MSNPESLPERFQPCARAKQKIDCQSEKRCTYEGMDGERWECTVTGCGYSYFLDYEEMK